MFSRAPRLTLLAFLLLLLAAGGPSVFAQICGSIGFYSPVNFPVSGRLQSVDVGDFNLDGKHDLVTANAVTTVVSVLLGNGDGAFKTSVDVNAGDNPGDAAVGDFNGDSKPDIAVANSGGNNISVLINTCAAAPCSSPSFAAPVNYASGNRPRRIATGDVNRDNILDLMTANENSNSISVLLGNGNGTFKAKVDFNPIGTQPYDLQVGDFNGDNKLDMVAVNFGMGDTAAVFINTCNSTPCAAPSFAAAVTYAVGESPMGVTTADFNGDNRLDIATANYFSSDVSILLGNGNGTFQTAVNYPSASLPNNITATDLDGDSYLDLVTAVDVGSLISVFRGRGDGTFEAKVDFNVGQSGASDVSKAVAAEDFNGDTLIDLAVAVDMFNNVSIMFNGCGDPPPSPASNTAPSITAGSEVSRTQGAGAGSVSATIATVSDAETDAGSLTVTATTVPTGISVTNITNTGGTITADVAADCTASPGANNVVLTVTDGGSMTKTANLTVNVTANATAISAHPGDETAVVGGSATFSVTASGSDLTYQWRKGGSPLTNVTSSSYTINPVSLDDAGSYDVVVTGQCGSPISNAATLTVNKADQTITFAQPANKVYGVAPFTLNATSSSSLPVSFQVVSGPATMIGNELTVTGAGTVTVRASQSGDATRNPAADVERSFAVSKATATIKLADLKHTYDGTAKAATATTTPSGLNVKLTYSKGGVTVASPTEAGTYDVAASIEEGNYRGGAKATLIITPAPVITIGDTYVYEGNAGTKSALFTVRLSLPATVPVTVDFATAGATAAEGEDFQAASATLTFNPGETSKTIAVAVQGDTLDEAYETFTVNLSCATVATLGDAQALGTIRDDDLPPTLSVSPAQVAEGGAGDLTPAVFNVQLSAKSGQTVTVKYSTPGGIGTASMTADYAPVTGTLTFAPGETVKQVTVQVKGDGFDEADETFRLVFSDPTNATIASGSGQVMGIITDDDLPPTISVSSVTVREGNGTAAVASFTVKRSGPSARVVTVKYRTADGTASAGADYTAASGTLTFVPGGALSQIIRIPVTGDTAGEGNETFTLVLSDATNSTLVTGQEAGTATILDDDPPSN